jgi:3-oxoacyl-[acyl-carrier-protein] synthase II
VTRVGEVWVTGAGVVSAAGAGLDSLRDALLETRGATARDDALGCETGRVGPYVAPPAARRLDRSACLFLAAAEEAWIDSGIDDARLDARRAAVIEGSSLGPLGEALAMQRRRVRDEHARARPSELVRFMTGAGGAVMAQAHGIRGPVLHLSAASVSAMCAIGEGCEKIRAGTMDVVVAGGAECPLDPEVVASFRAAGILADASAGAPACRPFDASRTGTTLGEGAGVLILESPRHARARGARRRGRILGFGLGCERGSLTGPDPAGAGVADAVRLAMAESGEEAPGWIKAHGTGTRVNDAAECAGLAQVFGRLLPTMPLTSLKSTLGHCLGASGGVEAVAALLCLAAGIVPATLGTTHQDPALAPCTVATEVRTRHDASVLLLAESFGGRCAAMLMR